MTTTTRSTFLTCAAIALFSLGGSASSSAAITVGGTGTPDCTFWCVDRVQQVYDSSLFSGVTTIAKVSFFASPTNGTAWNGVSTWQMSLSTSANPVGALSGTFANNVGGDNAVFDTETFPLGTPAVNSLVSFQGSFTYDPNLGDLLVDIIRTAGPDVGVGLDAGTDPGLIDRAYAFFSTVTADGVNQNGYAIRTRFDTAVPEPSAAILIVLGGFALVGAGRQGKKITANLR